jgi:hypothetical protein
LEAGPIGHLVDERGRGARSDTSNYETKILCWSNPLSTGVTGVVVDAGAALHPNRPNPFSIKTRLAYSLATSGHVSLRVYDVSGRVVRTLVEGEMPAGSHGTFWDGRNESGARASSGIYFARLETAGAVETQRIVLVR